MVVYFCFQSAIFPPERSSLKELHTQQGHHLTDKLSTIKNIKQHSIEKDHPENAIVMILKKNLSDFTVWLSEGQRGVQLCRVL